MHCSVKVKKLRNNACIPEYKTDGSAGMDVYYCGDENIIIEKGEICLIPSGIAIEIETDGFAAFIYARSGLASKYGIAMANGVGVVDSDYRGEIKCPLINMGSGAYTVKPGDRIGQMVIAPVARAEIEESDKLGDTMRGEGGFGSTGR